MPEKTALVVRQEERIDRPPEVVCVVSPPLVAQVWLCGTDPSHPTTYVQPRRRVAALAEVRGHGCRVARLRATLWARTQKPSVKDVPQLPRGEARL